MTHLEHALKDGHAQLSGEGNKQKIIYIAVNQAERYSDPEEKVRAEFWAELIYRYGYEPARIGVEIIVPDRTPSDRADLVIFHDDGRKRPYAVIECKKDGITDAEFNQAVEQACGNGTWAKFRASFVGVVAGRTRRFLDFTSKYGVLEREANIVADIPHQYGKPEEFKYHKSGPLDIQPISKEELITTIKKCHQTLWGGGKLSPPAAFGELSKIIFVKISDEQARRKKGEPYEFQIKTHEPSRRLAERIKALYERQKEKDPDVFTQTINIDDQTLRTVVSHLEGVNLSKTDLDTKGVAFEQFMDGFFKGDFGQYFTPREIISFAVEMMDPKADELVLDPSCGSGGFLLYALDKIRREADEYWDKGTDEHFRYWHDFAQKRLYGLEINDEIARVAKMNMIIHDDGHTNVGGQDALDRFERICSKSGNNGFRENYFDLILTNPPFGAQVNLSERPYLVDYDLGNVEDAKGRKKPRKNQKTEILFLERIWQFLKPGTGRAAVVLPDGILTNSSLQYVRDFILERFQLLAVVSLPPTAFSHFGAGVKASIVFLRKRALSEKPDDNEAIFMAAPGKIGYDATGKKCENELPRIIEQYKKCLKSPESFFRQNTESENLICFAIKLGDVNGKKLSVLWLFNSDNNIFKGSGYELVKISELGKSFSGGTPSKEEKEYWNGDIPWVSPKDLKEPIIKTTKDKISKAGLLNAKLKIVPERSILFTMRGLSDSSRLAGMNTIPVAINQDLRAFIPSSRVIPEYIIYLMDIYQDAIFSSIKKHSTTVQSIDAIALANFKIPLPPLEIQNKLAEEMKAAREEAHRLRAEAEQEWEFAKAKFEAQLLSKPLP